MVQKLSQLLVATHALGPDGEARQRWRKRSACPVIHHQMAERTKFNFKQSHICFSRKPAGSEIPDACLVPVHHSTRQYFLRG
jgi:hypothetical protein